MTSEARTKQLLKYLTPKQLEAYEEYREAFKAWRTNGGDGNRIRYDAAAKRFLDTTGNRYPCQMLPLGVS